MGVNTQSEKRKWLKINTKEGVILYKEGDEIKSADSFTGRLEDIKIKNDTYEGKPTRELQLLFDDLGVKYAVTVNADTGIANNILNTLLNIDKIGELTLGVFLSDKKDKSGNVIPGKKQSAVWIKNNGEKTNGWKYKRDAAGNSPEGFPDPVKTVFKGETMWDFSPVSQFLWDQTVAVTIPKLKGAGYVATSAPAADAEQQAPEDDLPW